MIRNKNNIEWKNNVKVLSAKLLDSTGKNNLSINWEWTYRVIISVERQNISVTLR